VIAFGVVENLLLFIIVEDVLIIRIIHIDDVCGFRGDYAESQRESMNGVRGHGERVEQHRGRL